MLKNSLSDDFLNCLDWQSVGEIAYVDTEFGLLIKNHSNEYWIIKDKAVLKLRDAINSKLNFLSDELGTGLVTLRSCRNNLFKRFINWVSGNERQFLPHSNESLSQLKEEKSQVMAQFLDADITIDQFIKRWDGLQVSESRVLVNNMLRNQIVFEDSRKIHRVSFALLALFLLGFFVGVLVNDKFTRYQNAEECILGKGGNRFTAAACYELYPSVSSKN